MAKELVESQKFEAKPGTRLEYKNRSDQALKLTISLEDGTEISIDYLIGANVSIRSGTTSFTVSIEPIDDAPNGLHLV